MALLVFFIALRRRASWSGGLLRLETVITQERPKGTSSKQEVKCQHLFHLAPLQLWILGTRGLVKCEFTPRSSPTLRLGLWIPTSSSSSCLSIPFRVPSHRIACTPGSVLHLTECIPTSAGCRKNTGMKQYVPAEVDCVLACPLHTVMFISCLFRGGRTIR